MWAPWVFRDGERPKWTTVPVGKSGIGLEAAIAWLAERQHGVVALPQLIAIGLTRRGVAHRVQAGALHRIYPGVFAVGRRKLSQEGQWMAAVLACGPGASLSYRSAAAFIGLRHTARTSVDVTVPARAGRRLAGIDTHRSSTLTANDITVVDHIPCTTVARTLLDLADVVSGVAVKRALDQAEVLRVFDRRALQDVLRRAGNRHGVTVIDALLAEGAEAALTRRELEERFLELCDRAGWDQPAVNAWVASTETDGYEVDFLWRRARLIVETDGWETHRTRRAFERDRERDQRLTLKGYRVLRFTWRQVLSEPDRVRDTIAALLRAAA